MKSNRKQDLSQASMADLFRAEAENQAAALTNGLLELERGNASPAVLEALMRSGHSLKGAARIIDLPSVAKIAHAMEDCFAAAQRKELILQRPQIDVLLRTIDLLSTLYRSGTLDLAAWEKEFAATTAEVLDGLRGLIQAELITSKPKSPARPDAPAARPGAATPIAGKSDTKPEVTRPAKTKASSQGSAVISSPRGRLAPAGAAQSSESQERIVRLAADSLNRMLGLAGESLVESRWLRPFGESLQKSKRYQHDIAAKLNALRQILDEGSCRERAAAQLKAISEQLQESRQFLSDRLQDLELYDRRSSQLSHRMYLEVLRTRMRPFGEGVRRFPRMVRDLTRALGKEVRLEIQGEATQVDREILERLEIPLAHLLRNAVDHGTEDLVERKRAGKPAECTIHLEARHSAGLLAVSVADDGPGVCLERVRDTILARGLATAETVARLGEAELLDFLFLPGFTLRETVTEISGRGVGLDVVLNMVKSVRGSIRLANQPGRGLRIQMQLPLTLSVVRALLVDVAGEPYAIPLSQINQSLKLSRASISVQEGRSHFLHGDQRVGLITAHEVLECPAFESRAEAIAVVVLGDRSRVYGLVVDRFLGERELVVQPLDSRLGKVQDISAAALMEDGSPALIIDVDDMIRSIERLVANRRPALPASQTKPGKILRVLVADDSLTVRELERKLLASQGYEVEVAADGMEAWLAVQARPFDLVITDLDMPHVDGFSLTRLIKQKAEIRSLPVIILSHKDSDADRERGLEAGADLYLTKGSFDDEALTRAVSQLI